MLPAYTLALPENEVDGEGFLLLTDDDIFSMVKPFGARRKLIAKRNELAKDTREDFDESQPTEKDDNNSYLADDEIIWEDDGEFSHPQEDDAEFSLSQYQDNDNYGVYM